MDVLIVAHYCDVGNEDSNNRFNYIAEALQNENINLELITSSFSHRNKSQRSACIKYSYKITLIKELGYKKNISLKRIISHFLFSKKVKNYLYKRKKPDVIYCAIPSISLANSLQKYAKKNNIKYFLDVQDLWPEAFGMILQNKVLSNILFYPMKLKVDKIYGNANYIFTVSNTYSNRVKKVNNTPNIETVYLGTDLSKFDVISIPTYVCKSDVITIVYIGTLGHSYDIPNLLKALKILSSKSVNYECLIIGDGPLKLEFEKNASSLDVNTKFLGKMKYDDMKAILKQCDIAVNPIVKKSAGSIINKVCDYAAAGLPVVNSQQCEEYKSLLNQYQSGINVSCEDEKEIANAISFLIENVEERKRMACNSRKMAEEIFDRRKTYKKIVREISEMRKM